MNKMDIFSRRMVNKNGDLQERVVYQRHMAHDIFQEASGVIDEALESVASGILAEDFVLAAAEKNIPNPHYIYSLDTNVVPDVSGTRNVGTQSTPWNEGNFNNINITNVGNFEEINVRNLVVLDTSNIRLEDLSDVEIVSPASGHVLFYDWTTGIWRNKHISQV
jgi:hypothetical protein